MKSKQNILGVAKPINKRAQNIVVTQKSNQTNNTYFQVKIMEKILDDISGSVVKTMNEKQKIGHWYERHNAKSYRCNTSTSRSIGQKNGTK